MKVFQIAYKSHVGACFNAELINTFAHENLVPDMPSVMEILQSEFALHKGGFIRAVGATTPDEVLINIDDISNIRIIEVKHES